MSSVISVIVTAFVTGALARFAVPGPDPMPAWLTILIGLIGTLIGAGIVLAAAGGDPAWIGIAGFFCSIALVLVYRRFVQKRAIWGPDAYRFPRRGVGRDRTADVQLRDSLEGAGSNPVPPEQALPVMAVVEPSTIGSLVGAPSAANEVTANTPRTNAGKTRQKICNRERSMMATARSHHLVMRAHSDICLLQR
jgi:uncharacterized membrane protein YeaQ/YmgE (transglycosylase-associated protein family)